MNRVTTDPMNLDIDALLAFHKATFGSARMEESTEETTEEQTTEESTEESTEGDKPEGEESTEGEPKKASPEDELPEWARKELTKARGEAANYRVKLREAETSLKDAKTPEEYEAARSELSSRIAELEMSLVRGDVARKYELPDDLADALKGDNKEALEAHAKVLAKYATGTSAPESLGGGLDPTDEDDGELNPGALARKHGRRY